MFARTTLVVCLASVLTAAAAVRPEADAGEGDADARRVRGDPQVRGQGEAAADPHGVAIDAAEDGLRKLPQAKEKVTLLLMY